LALHQHESIDKTTANSPSLIPHGQVDVTVQKMAEQVPVTADDAARIETFVYQILGNINVATKNSLLLEQTIVAVEMWSNHLAALALYISPRDTSGYKDSVQTALKDIQKLLDSKQLTITEISCPEEVTNPSVSTPGLPIREQFQVSSGVRLLRSWSGHVGAWENAKFRTIEQWRELEK
jgi:hypothetical protein